MVSDWLLGNRNSGSGMSLDIAKLRRYWTNAMTGHSAWAAFSRQIIVPVLNWSLLHYFRVICMDVGDVQLSKTASDNSRSVEER